MALQVADVRQRRRQVGVEVRAAERRFVPLVVAAEPERQGALPRDELLEIGDERPPQPPAPVRLGHDERMQLPHAASVVGLPADPADHRPRRLEHEAADPARRERGEDFGARCGEIGPGVGPVPQAVEQQLRGLLHEVLAPRFEGDNGEGPVRADHRAKVTMPRTGAGDGPSASSTAAPTQSG
ncbi:MAG TPA: hypothetical protein VGQ06_11755 [Gemmatimonadales bacterium]|nr:hypothetical protein [Gemmatimonadales bacterium]